MAKRIETTVEYDVRYLNEDGDADGIEFYNNKEEAIHYAKKFRDDTGNVAVAVERHTVKISMHTGRVVENEYETLYTDGSTEALKLWNGE